MLRYPTVLLASLMSVSLVLAAHAPQGPCGSDGQPALGIVEVTPGHAAGTFYVDDRNYALGNGVWIFEETNSIYTQREAGVYDDDITAHNVQRGGYCGMNLCPDDDEYSCVDDPLVIPDRLVF